jgi:hypothetical protein
VKNPDDPNEIKNDVLHPETHTQLSNEEVAKAVARHNREHPAKPQPAGKPNKKRGK